MAHRLIFTNTPSINYSLSQKFVVGSGVGSRNRSVYRALKNRASNSAQGKPCCIGNNTSSSGGVGCVLTPNDLPGTFDDFGDFTLNRNYTILSNCTLNIGTINFIIPAGITLINDGIIINRGVIFVIINNIIGDGILNNNGTLYLCVGGTIFPALPTPNVTGNGNIVNGCPP
uniref:Uncharacterized protein n=1 Tax=viral metagenome TaxID=1070528 RepID=A0A6C0HGW3_9ZZZZ